MKISINTPKVIQLPPDTYQTYATSLKNTLTNNFNLTIGEQVILKEHTGKRYTGREICAEVVDITGEMIKIRKWSVTHDTARGKQNKSDEKRNKNKVNKWNEGV